MNEAQRNEARKSRLLVALSRMPGMTALATAKLACISITSVRPALKELLEAGLVRVEVAEGTAGAKKSYFVVGDAAVVAKAKLNEAELAKVDPSLHARGAPIDYELKGVTTWDPETKQWIKTQKRNDSPQDFLDAFSRAVAVRELPVRDEVPAPEATNDRLMAIYPIGDPHFGLYAWCKMTGQDFNLAIAERNLRAAANRLIASMPPAKRAVVIPLGDFTHSDNMQNRTARSGNTLDVSDAWPRVMESMVDVTIHIVDKALEKHELVDVMVVIGNHDDQSSMMLALTLRLYYRNNPRVRVDDGYGTYRYVEFGNCLVGTTHGHTTKSANLAGVMACDRKEAWGRTTHRYWYCGHIHKETKDERYGVIWEAFRTLAASDNWAHSAGYRSGRSMIGDVLDIEHGRILRNEVGIAQIQGEAA